MTALVRAELRWMRGSRALVGTAAGGVAVAALAALAVTPGTLAGLLRTEVIVLTLFALLVGAVAGAGDFQHRTVVWTLLAAPGRLGAGVAKLAAAAIAGGALAAAVLGATWIAGALKAPGLPLGVGVGTLLAGQLALGMLSGAFGLAVGMALRSLPGAVAAVFALALVAPVLFESRPAWAAEIRFLPFGEASAAAQALGAAPATSGPQLAVAAGGAVLVGWTALVAAAALARLARQDV